MSNENVVFVRGKRPLSVWVLCIVNGLFAIVLIATSILAEDRGYSSGLAAFIAFAAWWFRLPPPSPGSASAPAVRSCWVC